MSIIPRHVGAAPPIRTAGRNCPIHVQAPCAALPASAPKAALRGDARRARPQRVRRQNRRGSTIAARVTPMAKPSQTPGAPRPMGKPSTQAAGMATTQ